MKLLYYFVLPFLTLAVLTVSVLITPWSYFSDLEQSENLSTYAYYYLCSKGKI